MCHIQSTYRCGHVEVDSSKCSRLPQEKGGASPEDKRCPDRSMRQKERLRDCTKCRRALPQADDAIALAGSEPQRFPNEDPRPSGMPQPLRIRKLRRSTEEDNVPSVAGDSENTTQDAPSLVRHSESITEYVPSMARDSKSTIESVPSLIRDSKSTIATIPSLARDSRSTIDSVPSLVRDSRSTIESIDIRSSGCSIKAENNSHNEPILRIASSSPRPSGSSFATDTARHGLYSCSLSEVSSTLSIERDYDSGKHTPSIDLATPEHRRRRHLFSKFLGLKHAKPSKQPDHKSKPKRSVSEKHTRLRWDAILSRKKSVDSVGSVDSDQSFVCIEARRREKIRQEEHEGAQRVEALQEEHQSMAASENSVSIAGSVIHTHTKLTEAHRHICVGPRELNENWI